MGVVGAALGACSGNNAPGSGQPDTAAVATSPAADSATGAGVAAPASGAVRVLFIGTSLTAGLGLDPEDAYLALVKAKADSAGLAVDVVNAGLSGETSAGALRRADWLLRERADVVVIETGANDGLRGLDIDSTRANIEGLVEKVRTRHPSARIVIAQMEAPPNLGEAYTRRFRDMYREVAEERGLVLMSFPLARVAGVAGLNQSDGIHPNEEGERIVAENVWRVVEPVLREVDRSRPGA